MSEWLDDLSIGRRVRLAPGRSDRPNDFDSSDSAEAPPSGDCPFCAGSTERTPPEADRIEDGEGGWLARTVPNLYPAFDGDDGVSEVVIESPLHTTRFIDLPLENATAAVMQWARRVGHWAEDSRFEYQTFFKNEGRSAGASLGHVHSQVVALKETPPEAERAWISQLDWRKGLGDRLVAEHAANIAFCPKAPRFAGETWIAPRSKGENFASLSDDLEASRALAQLIQALLRALPAVGAQHYNLMLMQLGKAERGQEGADWRLELAPRNAVAAGFEIATGLYINDLAPEAAAKKLRAAIPTPLEKSPKV